MRGTRGYIERFCHQINRSYENGRYDGRAVMIKRLIETRIIEAFARRLGISSSWGSCWLHAPWNHLELGAQHEAGAAPPQARR